ncbi:MAG TPA: ammonium transporter [Armatimonadota bacterium]|nr:ammonium transporter [Armatimonadota bacterium]
MDKADTGFVLLSSGLVMLMTPGLALFYGGMVRIKNVLSTLLQNFFMLGLMSIIWAVIGYSLAFGEDLGGGLLGGLNHVFLAGVGSELKDGLTIPTNVFMIFQAMFAIITPALFTGAIAERTKFGALMLFGGLWSIVVYSPVAHWVWGPDGWLAGMHALDFAGGTVVHINAAAAAFALVLVIGPRIGHKEEPMPPHSLPLTLLGAGLLWFGWFGFNAGSALAADGIAASAFVSTHLAAAAATFSWIAAEWLRTGKPTTLGAASGCVAGLVAVTPAAGFVTPMGGLAIGLVAGLVCYGAVVIKSRTRFDDSLDVVGIHGVGGFLGALLTGVFATTVVNPNGQNGLLSGNPAQLGVQFVGALVTLAYSFVVSFALAKLVDGLVGLRAPADDEVIGIDYTEHAERGYALY